MLILSTHLSAGQIWQALGQKTAKLLVDCPSQAARPASTFHLSAPVHVETITVSTFIL